MRPCTRPRILLVLAAASLAAAPLMARGERHPEHMITLGYQTEHADIVAVARPGPTTVDVEAGTTTAAFEIESAIRGDVAAGTRLTVVHRDLGHGPVWHDGAPHLVFLTRTDVANGSVDAGTADAGTAAVYESFSGAFGFRPVVPGEPSARFPEIAVSVAATLGAGPEVADPGALRALLVRMAGDTDDGIASNAALDLVRHEALHDGLTDAARAALVTSFRSRRPGRARRQIALAVAATHAPGAAVALVDAVLEPDSDRDRTGIAEALRMLGDPAAEQRALARLGPADPAQTRNLLALLRVVGRAAAVDPVRALIASPEPEVRADAAHTLGEVSRNVHRAAPEAAVAGRADLVALLERATTRAERRASLWALAQLDEPASYDVLRRVAADKDAAEDVRKHAAQLLERPRVSLVLD